VEPQAHESPSELASRVAEKEAGRSGKDKKKSQDGSARQPTLTEIGPRFAMTPIKIFEGSFSGATLFDNPGKPCMLVRIISYVLSLMPSWQHTQSTYLPTRCAMLSAERRANALLSA
jgi:hypothetical protein